MYIYILKSSKFAKTYVGITDDPIRRLMEHNSGDSSFTNKFKPWVLIYKEELLNRIEARRREKYFKSAAGRKKIKKIIYSAIAQW